MPDEPNHESLVPGAPLPAPGAPLVNDASDGGSPTELVQSSPPPAPAPPPGAPVPETAPGQGEHVLDTTAKTGLTDEAIHRDEDKMAHRPPRRFGRSGRVLLAFVAATLSALVCRLVWNRIPRTLGGPPSSNLFDGRFWLLLSCLLAAFVTVAKFSSVKRTLATMGHAVFDTVKAALRVLPPSLHRRIRKDYPYLSRLVQFSAIALVTRVVVWLSVQEWPFGTREK